MNAGLQPLNNRECGSLREGGGGGGQNLPALARPAIFRWEEEQMGMTNLAARRCGDGVEQLDRVVAMLRIHMLLYEPPELLPRRLVRHFL